MVVAALGPKMLELAGTVADGTVTWMTGPATLASHTVPTITAAAERAGRPAPRVVASLPICVTDDADAARGARRRRTSRCTASCRRTARCSTGKARPDRPTSRSSATRRRSRRRSAGLADAGVTEFVAAIYGSREERTDADTRALLKSML